MQDYVKIQYVVDDSNLLIILKEIIEQLDFVIEIEFYFVFVLIYFDGGNGIDNGVKELMINVLGEYFNYD